MGEDKKEILSILEALPDDATWEDGIRALMERAIEKHERKNNNNMDC